jgi:alkaline phosphatase
MEFNMPVKKIIILMTLIFAALTLSGYVPATDIPKNIILLIADGCGYNHIDATSLYQYGETGKQVYEQFPVKYAVSTYSTDGQIYDPAQAWASFEWVLKKPTDSAAAATAIAPGYKTRNGCLDVDPQGRTLETILERAEKLKKSSGVVTSVPYNHATPAGFCVHDTSRDDYAAITNYMFYTSPIDVIMGAGDPLYDEKGQMIADSLPSYSDKKSAWQKLHDGITGADADGDGTADAWTFIESRSDFQKLGTGPTPRRVIGLAETVSTLQESRSGDQFAGPNEIPFVATVPTLPEMSRAALNILDDDKDGFFLMIEGGAVDWAGHDNRTGRMIEEMVDFNKAVESVVDWVNTHSSWDETLVIVTADHETGYLTGPDSGKNLPTLLTIPKTWTPLVNNGPGHVPGLEWHSHDHTNSLVPLFAKGTGSDIFQKYADEVDPVRGRYIDNTEIGRIMFELWTK